MHGVAHAELSLENDPHPLVGHWRERHLLLIRDGSTETFAGRRTTGEAGKEPAGRYPRQSGLHRLRLAARLQCEGARGLGATGLARRCVVRRQIWPRHRDADRSPEDARASKRQSRRLCPSSRRVRAPSPWPPSNRSSCPPDRRSASPMVRIPIQTLSPTRRSDWKTIGITSGRTENSCL